MNIISRRRMLATVATVTGAIGPMIAAGFANAQAAAPGSSSSGNQMSKQSVQYQEQPKGQQRCSLCTNFVAPSACRVVAGAISPNGWCLLFKAKTP